VAWKRFFSTGKQRPLRIGVWCHYGTTLTPTEGIGVFVHNLMAALLDLGEPIEIVALVRPGEQGVMASLAAKGRGKFRVVPEQPCSPITGRLGSPAWFLQLPTHALQSIISRLRAGQSTPQETESQPDRSDIQEAQAAACDVWLIPYAGFIHPIDFPAVVVVHDLVVFHCPHLFEPEMVTWLREVIPARAHEATLCACMSDYIRRNDLLGELRLAEDKVRLVRAAIPRDFPKLSRHGLAKLIPERLRGQPYLFMPSAFRGHKNHRALLRALPLLHAGALGTNWQLVFTGATADCLPGDLEALAATLGVRSSVHVVGKVDRLTLAALYQGAYATVIPSLYEQGSFPICEAIHFGCPVACSDLPSLREQCRKMRDTMIFFDPNQPESIAAAVERIAADRAGVRDRQVNAGRTMWDRRWSEVAQEWLLVLRDAVACSRTPA
jgi:glycosyltransferase involved in cell wall biosynthesis